MSAIYLLSLAAIVVLGYVFGRVRGAGFYTAGVSPHSLPPYHGWFVALSAAIPMLVLFILWTALAPKLIEAQGLAQLPAAMQPTDDLSRATIARELQNVTAGGILADQANPEIKRAAETMQWLSSASGWGLLGSGPCIGGCRLFVGVVAAEPAISRAQYR